MSRLTSKQEYHPSTMNIPKFVSVATFISSLSILALIGPVTTTFAGDTARVWVRFAPERKADVKGALQQAGGKIHYEFDELGAVAVSVPEAALDGLRHNPNVELIEEDAKRELLGQA